MDRDLTFTRVCVDSSQTVLKHRTMYSNLDSYTVDLEIFVLTNLCTINFRTDDTFSSAHSFL